MIHDFAALFTMLRFEFRMEANMGGAHRDTNEFCEEEHRFYSVPARYLRPMLPQSIVNWTLARLAHAAFEWLMAETPMPASGQALGQTTSLYRTTPPIDVGYRPTRL